MSSSNLESQMSLSASDLAKSLRQDFDHDPRNHELAQFVYPDPSLVAPLRVVETPQEIRVDIWHCPLWFVALCLSPALAAAVWFWGWEFARGFDDPLKIVGFVITCLAFPATFALVVFMNRHIRAYGIFCVVDIVNSRIELPRLGISLSRQQILRFVEFRGWRDTGPPGARDSDREWSRELSAIVKNDSGSYSRYQVVLGEGWPVSRFGKRLSELFGVELTTIKK